VPCFPKIVGAFDAFHILTSVRLRVEDSFMMSTNNSFHSGPSYSPNWPESPSTAGYSRPSQCTPASRRVATALFCTSAQDAPTARQFPMSLCGGSECEKMKCPKASHAPWGAIVARQQAAGKGRTLQSIPLSARTIFSVLAFIAVKSVEASMRTADAHLQASEHAGNDEECTWELGRAAQHTRSHKRSSLAHARTHTRTHARTHARMCEARFPPHRAQPSSTPDSLLAVQVLIERHCERLALERALQLATCTSRGWSSAANVAGAKTGHQLSCLLRGSPGAQPLWTGGRWAHPQPQVTPHGGSADSLCTAPSAARRRCR